MRSERFEIGGYWLDQEPGSDKWYIYWYNKGTRRVSRRTTRTPVLSEAKIELANFVATNGKMRLEPGADVLLSVLLIRYYEKHAARLPSGPEAHRSCGIWMEYFGEITLADLTPDALDDFIEWLRDKKGYSKGYADRIISVGRAALKRAWRRQEITWVPYIPDSPGKKQRRERRLSIEEMGKLVGAVPARSPHVLMFMMVMINTLSRPEAVFDLTTHQYDFGDRIIDLNPEGREQTKKYRPIVPMTDTIVPWLEAVPKGHHVVEWAGRSIRSIGPTWIKMREAAGLDDKVVPYTIRHTMATYLTRERVRQEHVSMMLGHGIVENKTTGIYIHYDPDYLSDAKMAIEGYMQKLQDVVKTTDILHCTDVLLSKCSQKSPAIIRRERWARGRKRD